MGVWDCVLASRFKKFDARGGGARVAAAAKGIEAATPVEELEDAGETDRAGTATEPLIEHDDDEEDFFFWSSPKAATDGAATDVGKVDDDDDWFFFFFCAFVKAWTSWICSRSEAFSAWSLVLFCSSVAFWLWTCTSNSFSRWRCFWELRRLMARFRCISRAAAGSGAALRLRDDDDDDEAAAVLLEGRAVAAAEEATSERVVKPILYVLAVLMRVRRVEVR